MTVPTMHLRALAPRPAPPSGHDPRFSILGYIVMCFSSRLEYSSAGRGCLMPLTPPLLLGCNLRLPRTNGNPARYACDGWMTHPRRRPWRNSRALVSSDTRVLASAFLDIGRI